MTLELVRSTLHEERLDGEDEFTLAAGEKIRVQKRVGGALVDVMPLKTVPPGKKWLVMALVRIQETDA